MAATYDEQDRILTFGARTYAHAAHGEVASWTESGATTTLSYDVQGNLLAVGLPTGTLVQYEVDGRNRRLRRLVNGVATHGFLYQGQLRPVAELDGAGTLVSRFVYGARAVAPEYLIRAGVSYRLVTDHLGSVRLVVNTTSGAITQRLDYDAFGQVTLDTNPGFQPFGYAGGLYDLLTGLVRFGVRDYDPTIGRWLTKDPIGFQAGDSNLYAYVGNDPINAVDPTGLFVWELIDIVTFGQDVIAFIGCPGFWTGVAVVVGAIGALPGVTAVGWIDNVAKSERTLVIGRGADLDRGLGSNEFRLQWKPKPTTKAEWKENSGRIRAEMRQGNPIRDASAPDDTGGMYLNAERALLGDRGWTYNPGTGYWFPPSKR